MEATPAGGTDPVSKRRDPGYWIDDERLLRSEGVLFGLFVDGELDEKVAAIRAHFERMAVEARLRREAVDREIRRLETARAEAVRDEATAPAAIADAEASVHLSRYAVGLLLAVALCAFNYFLIYGLLEHQYAQPVLVALGVTLAGMFTLFLPTSIVHASDAAQRQDQRAPELWKQRLAEFGFPLAAALFVVSGHIGRMPVARLVVTVAYLLVLFLFGGKLLLSTLPRLVESYRAARQLRQGRKEQRQQHQTRTDARTRVQTLDEEIARREREREALTAPEVIDARCRSAVHVFLSEVRIGRDSRRRLSPADLRRMAQDAPVAGPSMLA